MVSEGESFFNSLSSPLVVSGGGVRIEFSRFCLWRGEFNPRYSLEHCWLNLGWGGEFNERGSSLASLLSSAEPLLSPKTLRTASMVLRGLGLFYVRLREEFQFTSKNVLVEFGDKDARIQI